MFGESSPTAQATAEAKKLTAYKKRAVFALSCVVLAFLLLSSAAQASASYPYTVNKAAIVYGLNWQDSDISYAAEHFDLVDMDFNGSRNDFYYNYYRFASLIKGNHSDLKILGYKDGVYMATVYDDWATAAANPSWFLKTAGGDYIYNSYWSTYLMDISNAGWQQHFIDYCNSKLAQGTGSVYDGVFMDDVWNEVSSYAAGFNGTVPAAKVTSWHNDMEAFLTHIQTDLTAGKMLLVNSDEFNTNDYIGIADGQMLEGFIHASWDNPSTYDSTHINLGASLAAKSALSSKIVFCSSGSNPYNAGILSQCYNNFVANSTNLETSYFAFNGYTSSDPHEEYFALMDTLLPGAPTPTPSPSPTPSPTPQYYVVPQAEVPDSTTNMGLASSGLVTIVKLCLLLGFGSVVVVSFIKKEPFEVIMEIFFVGIVGVLAVWFFI